MGARIAGMNVVTRFTMDTLERAVKTAAEFEGVYLFGHGAQGITSGFWGIDWHIALGYALGGFIASTLVSLGSQPLGDPFSASVLPSVGTTQAQ